MTKPETTYYDDVTQIPDQVFDDLGCKNTFYFEKEFLDAFAKANTTIEYRYLIVSTNTQAVALAIIQQLSVKVEHNAENVSLQNIMARSLHQHFNGMKVQAAICGNIFLSGNYGIFIKQGVDRPGVYEHIAKELKPLRTRRKASVFFLKDLKKTELLETHLVQNYQFQPFEVEPSMRLKLEWPDFDSYKASLRSKYRVKINKADSQSADVRIQSFSSQDIRNHLKILQKLYCNITDKAFFSTIDINIETYASLQERYKQSVFLNAYWYQDKIVGFATAFKVQKTLDAHFIGIDYEYNKELSIYPRILNDYVRMGFEKNCELVNFGRTSSEIKSTLGAKPENLNCYVRHRRTVANLLFKPLVRQIKMTEYKQHQPFK